MITYNFGLKFNHSQLNIRHEIDCEFWYFQVFDAGASDFLVG